MALTDVNFRMPSRFLRQQPRKKLKSHGKMMMVMGRSYSHAHTQAVGIHLDTRDHQSFINAQNTVVFMVEISLWHSFVALRTVDALSIAELLWQSTRNTCTDFCLSPMKILFDYADASSVAHFTVFEHYLVTRIGFCLYDFIHLCILVFGTLSTVVCVIFISLDALLMCIVQHI